MTGGSEPTAEYGAPWLPITSPTATDIQEETPMSDTTDHCQACGHPTSPADPATPTTEGATVHRSHTEDPRSGFYGTRATA